MRKNSFLGREISLLMMVFCVAELSTWAQRLVLPQAVVNAHTVFIQNETGFTELEFTAILELSKWGHFELSESREKADLILRLDSGTRVRLVPESEGVPAADGAPTEELVPPGYTRIALLEPKSGRMLWSGRHKTEGTKVKNGHLLDELREAFRDYEKVKR
jgi:hypothetical protein